MRRLRVQSRITVSVLEHNSKRGETAAAMARRGRTRGQAGLRHWSPKSGNYLYIIEQTSVETKKALLFCFRRLFTSATVVISSQQAVRKHPRTVYRLRLI